MMRFVSTRDAGISATLSGAIESGIAPDGGLYVPGGLPAVSPDTFRDADGLALVARRLLEPFFDGDPLQRELDAICSEAFNFPAPLGRVDGAPGRASVLELFHGPTSAFKDFGARFLAACLGRMHRRDGRLTILVATSGDTGGAVAAAFHGLDWADVVLLYPKGLVSPRQAQQLACWHGNVWTYAVSGTFDDCQRMVKEAFRDPSLAGTHHLTSANSINLGRLLPQMAYYADASLRIWRSEGRKAHFIIPTGNVGNSAACLIARAIGFPIGDVVLATNANRAVIDFLERGTWEPRPAVATLSSAMDVGNPSNLERVGWLFDDIGARGRLSACSVTDDEVRATIREDHRSLGRVWDPHTATAAHVYRQVAADSPSEHWVIVATAHPAKFAEIVEPLIGEPVPVPPALGRLLKLPCREQDLPPTLDALRHELEALPGVPK